MSLASLRAAALAMALAIVGSTAAAQPGGKPPAKPPAPAPAELGGDLLFQLMAAEMALQQGDAAAAYATFMDVARKSRDARVARRATEIAVNGRALPQALDAARLWQQLAPDSDEAAQAVGALLVSLQRYDEAAPIFAAQVQKAPVEQLATVQRLLARSADRAAALAFLTRLAQPYADDPRIGADVRLLLAGAAHSANDNERALKELQAALVLRPDFERAALAAAQLLNTPKADSANAAGRAQALALLQGFVERNPKAVQARLAYARLLVADNQLVQAREQFALALAAEPDNADALFAAALLAIDAGAPYAAARDYLQRYLTVIAAAGDTRRTPDAAYLNLARIAEDEGRYAEALDWLAKIDEPDLYLSTQLRRALVLAKLKRVDEARKLLADTRADAPQERVAVVVTDAQILREAGRAREAFDLLTAALAQAPDDPSLLYETAMAAEKLDRLDVMERNLRRLIELKPDDAHAYNALGYSLADRNLRLEEANALIGRALQLAPNDAYIIDSQGWVYYRMGKLPQAREYLERAWQRKPHAEVGAHLGEVLWQLD
ncbi:MAG: tetratricopeptide repeat protein, partial [Burkholderiales bacterium]|nr:tetratricopeptide repeat protein [Burkholderiales bacterium]